MRCCSDSYHS